MQRSGLDFGAKQFRIQGISSGTAGDSVERNPGKRGATVESSSHHHHIHLGSKNRQEHPNHAEVITRRNLQDACSDDGIATITKIIQGAE